MYVVKEAFNVEHEGSAVEAAAVRDMDIVEEGEARVQGAGEGTGAKLSGGDEAVGVDVVEEPFGDGLLEELAETLQKGDGAVVLGRRVVVAPRFGNNNDQGGLPRGGVVADPNTSIGEGGEVVLGL